MGEKGLRARDKSSRRSPSERTNKAAAGGGEQPAGEPQDRGEITTATLCVATDLAVSGASLRSRADSREGGGGTWLSSARLLPHRPTVLTGTAGLIKLGVNNGAEPPVSPAAVGALGGGGQTPFISGAGAGRVAKGTWLMGLHAFLHGGESGWCPRTNNFLADAPRATSNIEYSCSAAGHFSPHRPPPRSLSSRGYPDRGAREG